MVKKIGPKKFYQKKIESKQIFGPKKFMEGYPKWKGRFPPPTEIVMLNGKKNFGSKFFFQKSLVPIILVPKLI